MYSIQSLYSVQELRTEWEIKCYRNYTVCDQLRVNDAIACRYCKLQELNIHPNLDHPTPSPAGECVPFSFGARGGEGTPIAAYERGGGGSQFGRGNIHSEILGTLCLIGSVRKGTLQPIQRKTVENAEWYLGLYILYSIYQAASLFTQEISGGFRLVLGPKLLTYTQDLGNLQCYLCILINIYVYLYKIARLYVTNPFVCLRRIFQKPKLM